MAPAVLSLTLHQPRCACCAQDCDVYLLDDVLAGVDAHVAAWLTQHALLGPLVRGKTLVAVTHAPRLLAAASLVLEVRRGGRVRVVRSGSAAGADAAPSLPPAAADSGPGAGSAGAAAGAGATAAAGAEPATAPEQQQQAGSEEGSGREGEGEGDEESVERPDPPLQPLQQQAAEGGKEEGEEEGEGEEERAVGRVQSYVYLAYAQATGWAWVATIVVSLALMQVRCSASKQSVLGAALRRV